MLQGSGSHWQEEVIIKLRYEKKAGLMARFFLDDPALMAKINEIRDYD